MSWISCPSCNGTGLYHGKKDCPVCNGTGRIPDEHRLNKAATPSLTPLRAMLEHARTNGLKNPILRAESLRISLAKDNSSNPGCLYVLYHDTYAGKINRNDQWLPLHQTPNTVETVLYKLAANPLEMLTLYGKKTGRCACCGRKLTNEESVKLGIGPICKARLGI